MTSKLQQQNTEMFSLVVFFQQPKIVYFHGPATQDMKSYLGPF